MRLSADPTGEIDELVEALESAHSPWQKVKVLARSWQTVRKLRPDERFLVAKHVGLDGAEVFLEKLGDPYRGLPTDELLAIVRAAEAEDFERWKRAIGRLRRPEERDELLRKGFGRVKEGLLEKSVTRPEPVTPEAEALEAVPVVPPVVPEKLEETPEAQSVPVLETEAHAEREEALEESLGEPEEEVKEPRKEAELPALALAIETQPAIPSSPDPIVEQLAAPGTVLSRLRRFRLLCEKMRHLERSTVQQLLRCLPAGWARRRALARLFEAGIPERFQDALALTDTLEGRTDRQWCLSTLVASRSFSPDEKESLLTRVESPVLRRRLEIRLGR